MRLAFKPAKITIFLGGVLLGVTLAWMGRPLYQRAIEYVFRDQFYKLTEACDTAMRVHLVAKSRLDLEPSDETVQQLKSAELGLLSCQDYDLMRKRLIRYGLNENALSEMTLDFAEARASDLILVVKTHEFRY